MSYALDFASRHFYDSLMEGITVFVRLGTGRETVIDLLAKIDTGSSACLFERRYADLLGLTVEDGEHEVFSTAVGTFHVYGHEVTIHVLDIECTSTVYFFADYAIRRNVLDRRGWLDRVKLGIVDYESTLYLSAHAET
jgi:hypothetical protein